MHNSFHREGLLCWIIVSVCHLLAVTIFHRKQKSGNKTEVETNCIIFPVSHNWLFTSDEGFSLGLCCLIGQCQFDCSAFKCEFKSPRKSALNREEEGNLNLPFNSIFIRYLKAVIPFPCNNSWIYFQLITYILLKEGQVEGQREIKAGQLKIQRVSTSL